MTGHAFNPFLVTFNVMINGTAALHSPSLS